MQRAFKGVWIPKEIWLNKNLSLVEKVLLVEIDSLDNGDGCWASNGYFAEFFGLSKNRISILISSLEKKGFITTEIKYKKGSRQIEKRIIKNRYAYLRKHKGGICENEYTPICENAKDNNTSINNTNNIPYVEIVTYLNDAAHKNFRPNTKATQRLIKARWNEGFRLKDFQTVIDKKTAEWLHDTKMNQYLRPETLFGTKFESYLNQDYVTGDSNTPTRPKEFEYDINAGED